MSLGVSAAGWAAIGAVGATAVSAYGSNKAASTQAEAAANSQAEAAREYDQSRADTLAQLAQTREDQAPYRTAGKSALEQIMSGIAEGGQFAQKFDGSTLTADPGYKFRLDQGTTGINRAAAASGAAYSGATLKALARFNSGLASDEFSNGYQRFTNDQDRRFNRLASLAGVGQTATNQTQSAGSTATGQLNTLGANFTSNTNANLGAMGEARASGYVANANAMNSGIKGLYNAYNSGEPFMSYNPAALRMNDSTGGGGASLASLAGAGSSAGNYNFTPSTLPIDPSVTAIPTF